ncbi:MAG: pentapeptide repeat-containing protein, partial [Bacteriovoracaceae bacterium]
VSGALFSLSTFKTSSFSSCVFYSCKWENTVFKNCTFENCTFQFSHLYDVQFTSCKFINCAWEFTTAKKSKALSSELDRATAKEFSKYDNNTINCCFASDPELTQRSIELIELHKEWDKAA